jgi:hypothetical protein
MVRDGMQLAAVCAVAGHAQIKTTERYIHLASEDVKEEAKRHSPIKSWVTMLLLALGGLFAKPITVDAIIHCH